MKQPTMQDVAKKAGVSKATVSHVVNNTRFVEENTKQRVLSAIADLGFRPSAVARSLTTNQTHTIGIVVSDTSNIFFGEMLHGVEDFFRPKNYSLIVCNTAEILERESSYLDLLLRQRVDGIIAAATSQRWDILTEVVKKNMPVIFVDRAFEGMSDPYVGVDNAGGAYKGTNFLIECGHRKLGILTGFLRLSSMCERLAGFKKSLHDHNLPLVDEWVVNSELSIEGGRNAMMQLMSSPERPTAVFINNNLLTLGALQAIKELGLDCPKEIALIGFDDTPWAEVTHPALTVIRQPAFEVGYKAAEMLLTLIERKPLEEKKVLFDCELILRESHCEKR